LQTLPLGEYLGAGRFPATTRPGLTPKQQLMIGAFNCDSLKGYSTPAGSLSNATGQRARKNPGAHATRRVFSLTAGAGETMIRREQEARREGTPGASP
jgi:hypothetical protein